MAAANWPSYPTLPQGLLFDGHGFTPGDGRAIDKPEVGPSIIRLRTTVAPDRISGDMLMSDTQFTSFQTFVGSTISDGSLPFMFPHHETGVMTLVQFTEGFWGSARVSGGRTRVHLELEYLP